MNDQPHRLFHVAGYGQFDYPYTIYDGTYAGPFSATSEPRPRLEGVGFWYRPDPSEAVTEHNTLLYNQSLPIAHSPLEQTVNSVKHRRTRSGCFTCRHRRVKCDETRPICERCQKGNRECQFPQPSSSSSRRSEPNESRSGLSRSSAHEIRSGSSQALSAIDDESEEGKEGSMSPVSVPSRSEFGTPPVQSRRAVDPRRKYRRWSNVGEEREDHSPISARTTSPQSRSGTPTSAFHTPPADERPSIRSQKWKHLSTSIQQYLRFHRDHITHYHYFLKFDPNDFVHNQLIDTALSFEPLLYAVVGFAAYHHTLNKPDGRFQEFWKYYCQSIMLLRKWLESNTTRNEAVLLTILQLASFEEYLGDWASLASHQKAAYSIFSTLYTYDNMMATETSRCIFDWLARADVVVSLSGGATTKFDRQWFVTALEWHKTQVNSDALDAAAAMACFVAKLRLIWFDMAVVFASTVPKSSTMRNIQLISKKMNTLRLEVQTLHESTHSARTAAHPSRNGTATESTFDSQIPLFRGKLWPLNFIWIDWYATDQMLKHRAAVLTSTLQTQPQLDTPAPRNASSPRQFGPRGLQNLSREIEKLSLIQCQIFEAIEKSPYAPSGAILGCQASLALSCIFLENNPKYTMWARRKLANMERMGYIWPPSFRGRISQIWGDESVLDWWLPDGELKISLLDEIREVVEERNREIEDRGGDERDEVREFQPIFDKLEFGRGNQRIRRDSVWSAMGTEAGTARTIKHATAESETSEGEDTEEDDNDDDDDEIENNDMREQEVIEGEREEQEEEAAAEVETERKKMLRQRPTSRDSGVGNSSTAMKTTVEYPNRMSGIWEEAVPR